MSGLSQGSAEGLPLRGAGLLGWIGRRAGDLPRLHPNLADPLQGRHPSHQGIRLPGARTAREHPPPLPPALRERFPVFGLQASEYPVILSLENHCSVKQQQVVAQHMSSILGSALITSPLGDTMPTDFPSPAVRVLLF